jgi:hypothetical protein
MKRIILLLSVVFLCITSCKKENKNEDLYYSDTLLSQVISGDQAIHGLTYNSSYLIYESMEPFVYNKYTYDSQNILRKEETAFSFSPLSCAYIPGASLESDPRNAKVSAYSEYEYDNSLKLIKKSIYSINNGTDRLSYYHTFEYKNGNLTRVSIFNAQGQMTQYNDYSYDDNGNMTKDDMYLVGASVKLYRTMIYEFDNKNNPYKVFSSEGTPGKNTNRNNITKETQISYSGTVENRNTTLHTYSYNDLDYPVKIDQLDCKYGK